MPLARPLADVGLLTRRALRAIDLCSFIYIQTVTPFHGPSYQTAPLHLYRYPIYRRSTFLIQSA